MRRSSLAAAFAACAVAGAACSRGEPPAWRGDAVVGPTAQPLPGDAARLDLGAPPRPGAASPALRPDGGANRSADGGGPAPEDDGALPQTRERPRDDAEDFLERMGALVRGVAEDDAAAARAAFFPLAAYRQVKDVGNPEGDFRVRLLGAYRRDLGEIHAALGPHARDAKLVRVEVPAGRAKWVEPGEEWNTIGYWRVFGTRVVVDVGGRERSFEVKSLISWRGRWYVVHLSSFK